MFLLWNSEMLQVFCSQCSLLTSAHRPVSSFEVDSELSFEFLTTEEIFAIQKMYLQGLYKFHWISFLKIKRQKRLFSFVEFWLFHDIFRNVPLWYSSLRIFDFPEGSYFEILLSSWDAVCQKDFQWHTTEIFRGCLLQWLRSPGIGGSSKLNTNPGFSPDLGCFLFALFK